MHYYTDGACNPNPGVGGWGLVVLKEEAGKSLQKFHEEFGGEHKTTNNRMEMMAIIKALEFALRNNDESPKIFTDSKLSLNTCETWIHGWVKKKILRTKKNPDLLEQVYPLLLRAKPKFQWVRGHNGDRWNEHADMLSNRFYHRHKEK